MKYDESIRQMVIDELETEPSIDASAIGVAVNRGVVTLSGKVDTFAKKHAAEAAAQRVPGITALAEDIEVQLGTSSKRTDTELASAAASMLAWDVNVPTGKIKVKAEGGWITLSGSVKHAFEKAAAIRSMRNLTGVRGVYNLISVETKADPERVKKEISRVLHRVIDRDLERITVETRDGIAALRGTVRTWAEREEAERAACNVPGVVSVQNHLSIGV